jgi:hypothetical protein
LACGTKKNLATLVVPAAAADVDVVVERIEFGQVDFVGRLELVRVVHQESLQ